MRRQLTLAAVLAGLALAGQTGQAQAAVTLGSDVAASPHSDECSTTGGCFAVHQTLPGRRTRAPWRGVIVRWRVRGSGSFMIAPVTYRGDDTIVRSAGSKVRVASSRSRVSTFPSRLILGKDQHVGLFVANGATVSGTPVDGADADGWTPAPAVGQTKRANHPDRKAALAFNVDVEPDADGDGYGDETQDRCPSDRSTQGPCPAPPPPPQPPPPPPPPPPADTVPPLFTSGPSIRPRVFTVDPGAKLSFGLSESASITVVVRRRGWGEGVISRPQVDAGKNAIRIRDRVGDRRLRAGRYAATVTATDAHGNRSTARLKFRVKRRR